jgi:hypothetical protein
MPNDDLAVGCESRKGLVLMGDTESQLKKYPQHDGQQPGYRFAIAKLVVFPHLLQQL